MKEDKTATIPAIPLKYSTDLLTASRYSRRTNKGQSPNERPVLEPLHNNTRRPAPAEAPTSTCLPPLLLLLPDKPRHGDDIPHSRSLYTITTIADYRLQGTRYRVEGMALLPLTGPVICYMDILSKYSLLPGRNLIPSTRVSALSPCSSASRASTVWTGM